MFGQTHVFSPNYPRFSPMGGALLELGRGGDSSRHKQKVSPPWVCSKCAKKHPDEMGCPEKIEKPGTRDYYEVETTEDVDQVLGADHVHRSAEEQMGCDKCQDRRRKKKAQAPYNMRGLPVSNLGHTHLSQTGAEYTCPVGPTPSYDPTLNCMRDARGNAVCSDGSHYPPDCPKTPPAQYFTPGVTPDVVSGSQIEGQIPPPRAPGSTGGGPSTGTIVAAAGGALGLGALLFFLFK